MSEHINPADCKPDEVYMGTVNGQRCVMVRNDPEANHWQLIAGKSAPRWATDPSVAALAPLGEMRPMTREDLPSEEAIANRSPMPFVFWQYIPGILDAVVEHLNERGGVPDEMAKHERAEIFRITGRQYQEIREELDEALDESSTLRDDRDHWREQAHSNAVERDDWKRSATEWEESHADAVRDRNAWKGRAESDGAALKREWADRDEWREQAGRNGTERDELSVRVGRMVDEITSHSEGARAAQNEASRLRRERDKWRQQAEKAGFERDGWKAAAEHRGQLLDTPAALPVTYVEVEYAINGAGTPGDPRWLSRATDAVWQLVSGEQPAVIVVRESQIVPCQRDEDDNWELLDGPTFFDSKADRMGNTESIQHHREQIVQRASVIRAIEAEQAHEPDPDEVPRRLWEASRGVRDPGWDELVAEAEDEDEMGDSASLDAVDRMRRMAWAGITPPEDDQ